MRNVANFIIVLVFGAHVYFIVCFIVQTIYESWRKKVECRQQEEQSKDVSADKNCPKEQEKTPWFLDNGCGGCFFYFYLLLLILIALLAGNCKSSAKNHSGHRRNYKSDAYEERYERWGRWIDVRGE